MVCSGRVGHKTTSDAAKVVSVSSQAAILRLPLPPVVWFQFVVVRLPKVGIAHMGQRGFAGFHSLSGLLSQSQQYVCSYP